MRLELGRNKGAGRALGVGCALIFRLIDAVIGLRVDEDVETEGLDIEEHEEHGYNM